jgi:hypothetical protein
MTAGVSGTKNTMGSIGDAIGVALATTGLASGLARDATLTARRSRTRTIPERTRVEVPPTRRAPSLEPIASSDRDLSGVGTRAATRGTAGATGLETGSCATSVAAGRETVVLGCRPVPSLDDDASPNTTATIEPARATVAYANAGRHARR